MSAFRGNLLEMQDPMSHPRCAESGLACPQGIPMHIDTSEHLFAFSAFCLPAASFPEWQQVVGTLWLSALPEAMSRDPGYRDL